MKFNCIAVDDDPANLALLCDYLATLDNYELIESFTDPIKAMNFIIAADNVDIVFMDVEMPGLSGIDLAKIIRHKTRNLIFTTAHSKYALDAFEIEADAFLLKPFSLGHFATALHKLQSRRIIPIQEKKKSDDQYFFIKSKNDKSKLVKIRFDEIIAIESIQNYISIYTTQKTVVAHITLTKIKEILKDNNSFIQIHRSFIISRNYLEEIENNLVRMKNDLLLTIGENYRDELIGFVKTKTIKTGRN
ncbi:LytR/AlgR family response regulator transcription factor [Pedobacter zeae]|uniref:DNA-binding LytR/AlgR family response regulator n=1 Tax=Pedobacter zeae TaxID=1737356 RepID=A0A7W6K6V5_9SPHI|nr:LytTR family DNA-binding domain-containing protein [Pedobacter zeae]MBB4106255.1 DNA-binding LytR/AlgR family response regulator [Pedobacter zeae]GGH00532.1 DNA-binding response regulator [Pedobacter zeae]